MSEWAVGRSARIHADSPYQRRMCRFDAVGGLLYHPGVANVHLSVAIQVIHVAVSVVVDEDVGCVTIHMAAQGGASTRVPAAHVVLWRAETAHDGYAVSANSVRAQIVEDQLHLVHELHLHDDVLWPHRLLVVRKEVLQLEVI